MLKSVKMFSEKSFLIFLFLFLSFRIVSSENSYIPSYKDQIKINISFNLFFNEKGLSFSPRDNYFNKKVFYSKGYGEAIRDALFLGIVLPVLGTVFGLAPAIPLFAVGGYNCYYYYNTKLEWYLPLFIVGGLCSLFWIGSFCPLISAGFMQLGESAQSKQREFQEKQKEKGKKEFNDYYIKAVKEYANKQFPEAVKDFRTALKKIIDKKDINNIMSAYIGLGLSSEKKEALQIFDKAINERFYLCYFYHLYVSADIGDEEFSRSLNRIHENKKVFSSNLFLSQLYKLFSEELNPEEFLAMYSEYDISLFYAAMYYKVIKKDFETAGKCFTDFSNKSSKGLFYYISKFECEKINDLLNR